MLMRVLTVKNNFIRPNYPLAEKIGDKIQVSSAGKEYSGVIVSVDISFEYSDRVPQRRISVLTDDGKKRRNINLTQQEIEDADFSIVRAITNKFEKEAAGSGLKTATIV